MSLKIDVKNVFEFIPESEILALQNESAEKLAALKSGDDLYDKGNKSKDKGKDKKDKGKKK